jgi:glycerol-3-phosphate dehydrogenase
VAWAVRHELALSVDDVLSRRLRLSPALAARRPVVASRVAAIMAAELGWGQTRCELERETYLATAGREYDVA